MNFQSQQNKNNLPQQNQIRQINSFTKNQQGLQHQSSQEIKQ